MSFGNSERLQKSIEVMGSIIQKRIVVLCKTFEAIIGGSGYVLSYCFYFLSSGSPMWSWDRVGLKTLRRRKKVNGLKKERLEQIDPLETSSLSLTKKGVSYVVTGQNLSGLWFMLV